MILDNRLTKMENSGKPRTRGDDPSPIRLRAPLLM